MNEKPLGNLPVRNIILAILAVTVFTGSILAWYASEHPDGLEWSIEKVTGSPELASQGKSIHHTLKNFQEKTSLMPDYSFKQEDNGHETSTTDARIGTTTAGLFGGLLVLLIGVLMGFILKRRDPAA